MAVEYQDIDNPVLEKSNMGGAWQEVLMGLQSDFAEFATVPAEDSTRDFDGMNMLSVGEDRLKPGKRLYSIYNTLEKVSLMAEPQGEYDGMSHKIVLKLYTPGLTSKALALLKIPNQNFIFYVRTGDQMFRVGGPRYAAKKAPEGSVGTGDKTGSPKGNEMVFHTYEDGFAPEVVNINNVLAMVNAIDEDLTATFSPAHAAVTVAVDANVTITMSEAVVNADTLAAFTNQEVEEILTLESLDVDGNVVAAKPFAGSISGNVITLNPTTDFAAATIYQVKFDATKILSSAAKGRVNGANYARFTTA